VLVIRIFPVAYTPGLIRQRYETDEVISDGHRRFLGSVAFATRMRQKASGLIRRSTTSRSTIDEQPFIPDRTMSPLQGSKVMVVKDALLEREGVRILMLGNVAIARGAIEAGVQLATGYPGTPSSEIVESLSLVGKELGIYVEWSTNEKVAYEEAFAASLAGIRGLTVCKHLGVNWLADALLVSAYTGVNGGLVLVVADDPQPYSSQTAQDTRYYAKLAKIPCIEPSNVQESKDIIRYAFEISEKIQLPIMVRVTPRICHTWALVRLGRVSNISRTARFDRDPKRYVMIASATRERHRWLNQQFARAMLEAEESPFNSLDGVHADTGIIASGMSYSYVVDALDRLEMREKVSLLKLSSTVPIPENLIARFTRSIDRVLIVEEGEPIVERDVEAIAHESGAHVTILGKKSGHIPREGELTPDLVAQGVSRLLNLPDPGSTALEAFDNARRVLITRTPYLCAGCPHRASYYAIKHALRSLNRKGIVVGDRGCYNQGVHPPLNALDTCICMGASISMAVGFDKSKVDERAIAVLGDSTFFHAGIPALINAVWNKAGISVIVLDNGSTAMTGHQPNPSSGLTADGTPSKIIRPEDIARACGVDSISVVDPYNLSATISAVRDSLEARDPSLVVCRHPCTIQELRDLRAKGIPIRPSTVDYERCTGCKICISQLGCPAMSMEEGKVAIDRTQCVGCGVCTQVCPNRAIVGGGGHEA
jgi:indolepyruvate ferredoxin oxidoreductase alpha subunit